MISGLSSTNYQGAIGVDFAAIVPDSMVIEFVEASISGTHELYEKRADWMDRQVSKLVLEQTGTTYAEAGGYATGTVHNDVREDIDPADAKQLQATLNRDLTRPIVDLNFGPQDAYPRIHVKRPDQVDVGNLVKNVSTLVPMGLKVGMSTMRDRLGLPDPGKDEELLTAPSKTAPAVDEKQEMKEQASSTAGADDAVDRAIDDFLAHDGWEPLIGPIDKGLEAELAVAGTAEEAREVLNRRLETMGPAAFTDALAQAAFASRLAGEAEEDI